MIKVLVSLVLASSKILAHDPGMSSVTVDLSSRDLLVQVLFASADLAGLHTDRLADLAAQTVELRGQTSLLRPISTETREIGVDNIEYTLRFARPSRVTTTFRSPLLRRLAFGHRQSVTVRDEAGVTAATEVLSVDHDYFSLPAARRGGTPASHGISALLVTSALAVMGIGWSISKRRAPKAAV